MRSLDLTKLREMHRRHFLSKMRRNEYLTTPQKKNKAKPKSSVFRSELTPLDKPVFYTPPEEERSNLETQGSAAIEREPYDILPINTNNNAVQETINSAENITDAPQFSALAQNEPLSEQEMLAQQKLFQREQARRNVLEREMNPANDFSLSKQNKQEKPISIPARPQEQIKKQNTEQLTPPPSLTPNMDVNQLPHTHIQSQVNAELPLKNDHLTNEQLALDPQNRAHQSRIKRALDWIKLMALFTLVLLFFAASSIAMYRFYRWAVEEPIQYKNPVIFQQNNSEMIKNE